MDWHQPWLLGLTQVEVEELHDYALYRSRAHKHAGRFGLAQAWLGLAHEAVERLLELQAAEGPQVEIPGQLRLTTSPVGAYDHPDIPA